MKIKLSDLALLTIFLVGAGPVGHLVAADPAPAPVALVDGMPPSSAVGAGASLPLLLRGLDCPYRVLYVTAHPDDEDSAVIAWLVHGLGVEVRLLTLTRGEGGQNEIGPELFDALGVLRSRELEAARRIDGASQRFARAFEFGYSFSVEETFEKWHRESILRDVVRELREFQPDVLLTMPTEGAGGGQHHQASARIAGEAFTVAATERWPELGPPHRTRRWFEQVWGTDELDRTCAIDNSVRDPLLGASYAELALRAQAAHKCQGMARLSEAFPQSASRWRWVRAADEEPSSVESFFADLSPGSTIRELQRIAELRSRVAAARAALVVDRPDSTREPLLRVWDYLADPTTREVLRPVVRETLVARTGAALQLALGVATAARAATPIVAAGAGVDVRLSVVNGGERALVVRGSVRGPAGVRTRLTEFELPAGQTRHVRSALTLPPVNELASSLPVALPRRADLAAEGSYRNPAWCAFWFQPEVDVDGRTIALPPRRVEAERFATADSSVVLTDLFVVPDPSIRPVRSPIVLLPGRPARVELWVSSVTGGAVEVGVDAPRGWSVPPPIEITTRRGGHERRVTFVLEPVTASTPSSGKVAAWARHQGVDPVSRTGYRWIEYPHVRAGALLEVAESELILLDDCSVPSEQRVAYVTGVGDEVPAALDTLGITWHALDEGELSVGALDRFDVILVGVRAYKVREDLRAATAQLQAWMERGGRLVVQFQKFEFNDGVASSPFAPFPGAAVSSRRVTVEESPVTARIPGHPLLSTPNSLGASDWDGWVQERGLYFLEVSDERYEDLLTLEDPWPYNAGPRGGALVHARVGRGGWVYVGLGLFRQLPAGVPGAYRLLANLLAPLPE